jgi:hypothetical protein
MPKAQKNRTSKQAYISPNQLTLVGFETPFEQKLTKDNRWVLLAQKIPWDILVDTYQAQMKNHQTGASGINPRVAIGALIIKHLSNLSDRETVLQIQENMFMQYFLGFSSYTNEIPFDPSLFVDLRKRLGAEQINAINEKILGLSTTEVLDEDDQNYDDNIDLTTPTQEECIVPNDDTHKGALLMDATACPQDIAYPTDLNLLNDSREKLEEFIDVLYTPQIPTSKPRTDRTIARKLYLQTAQKKVKSKKVIRRAIKKQLSYVRKNIKHVESLVSFYHSNPLNEKQQTYLQTIQLVYKQQLQMYQTKQHSVEDRIVSIHQPHVRPIVRGKTNANVEFGSKIQVSLMNGYAFLDELSWDAFNEGVCLKQSIRKYKQRFGFFPKEVLADKIYCNRTNRNFLKRHGIKLKAKPLGRPKAVEVEHVSPGERNPIEGKFGQGKTRYGMNKIKARLQQTSESWIATIILVLNLVKLAGSSTCVQILIWLSFSARSIVGLIKTTLDFLAYIYNEQNKNLALT